MAALVDVDYGEAINIVSADGRLRADMSGPMVTGSRAVVMRVLHRVTMSPGALFYAVNVGKNLLDLVNATDIDLPSYEAEATAEALREQGVSAARCKITRSTADQRTVFVSMALDISGSSVGFNLIVSPGQAAKVLFVGV